MTVVNVHELKIIDSVYIFYGPDQIEGNAVIKRIDLKYQLCC